MMKAKFAVARCGGHPASLATRRPPMPGVCAPGSGLARHADEIHVPPMPRTPRGHAAAMWSAKAKSLQIAIGLSKHRLGRVLVHGHRAPRWSRQHQSQAAPAAAELDILG